MRTQLWAASDRVDQQFLHIAGEANASLVTLVMPSDKA